MFAPRYIVIKLLILIVLVGTGVTLSSDRPSADSLKCEVIDQHDPIADKNGLATLRINNQITPEIALGDDVELTISLEAATDTTGLSLSQFVGLGSVTDWSPKTGEQAGLVVEQSNHQIRWTSTIGLLAPGKYTVVVRPTRTTEDAAIGYAHINSGLGFGFKWLRIRGSVGVSSLQHFFLVRDHNLPGVTIDAPATFSGTGPVTLTLKSTRNTKVDDLTVNHATFTSKPVSLLVDQPRQLTLLPDGSGEPITVSILTKSWCGPAAQTLTISPASVSSSPSSAPTAIPLATTPAVSPSSPAATSSTVTSQAPSATATTPVAEVTQEATTPSGGDPSPAPTAPTIPVSSSAETTETTAPSPSTSASANGTTSSDAPTPTASTNSASVSTSSSQPGPSSSPQSTFPSTATTPAIQHTTPKSTSTVSITTPPSSVAETTAPPGERAATISDTVQFVKVAGEEKNLAERVEIPQGTPLQVGVIQGAAAPGETVTVTVYSEPRVYTVTSDSTGHWSLEIPTADLAAGEHRIEYETPSKSRTELMKFQVMGPIASETPVATNSEFALSADITLPATATEPSGFERVRTIPIWLWIGAGLFLVGFIFLVFIHRRRVSRPNLASLSENRHDLERGS